MSEIFEQLESNDKNIVENAKQKLRDLFKKVNEPWLLNGLYDLYLKTNSVRYLDSLVSIKEPHYNFLFDKLQGSLKSQTQKTEVVQALTLLGHIVRSQPTWLYKLADHSLLQDLFKLLKHEMELVPLISALLVLIVLLPIIPSSMADYLREMFEIFSRLAAWNCNPGKVVEDQMIHMQVALYALFLRLYGMYPCNFVSYLKTQYKDRNNPVFVHTIKPMLNTVRMHPSLVTSNMDNETTTERWKKMGVHDVIVECERFSLDLTDRCPHDTCQFTSGFRSRSGTTNSSIEAPYHLQNLIQLTSTSVLSKENFFTPSSKFHALTSSESIPHVQGVHVANYSSQESSSPPEAAIEATPETTPVRDLRSLPKPQPLNSNVARALTNFTNKKRSDSLNTTPINSQPSSPMRKDFTQFTFPTESKLNQSLKDKKLHKLIIERGQANESLDLVPKGKHLPPPSSPLSIKSDPKSHYLRIDSPISQEDEEVSAIVMRGESTKRQLVRCESIAYDDMSDGNYDDEQEHGSPCTEGGLHMPNSKSMNNFAKNMQRLRYHSQCNPESDRVETSTGSSPGNCVPFANNATVRRANSCPEMKKSPNISTKDNIRKPLDETDEETISEDRFESNHLYSVQLERELKKCFLSCTTQTDNFWPMPYEPLFLVIFPSIENEIKPSPAPSPAPINLMQDRYQPSIYEILDKYIETAVSCNEKDSKQSLKDHLQLLHQQLLFERHRRETHAYRNRRLLADAKSTRLLEECNSALRDQVHLHQKEIDNLRSQLESFRKDRSEEDKKYITTVQYWETQCKALQVSCKEIKEQNENLERSVGELKAKCSGLEVEKQQSQSSLLDAIAEVNIAKEQASAGEKGRAELEQANKELLLIGELQLKYQEALSKLSSFRQIEQELEYTKETFKHEVKALSHHLDSKVALLEACQQRISELEQNVAQCESIISLQKRSLSGANEEHDEKLKAVESKYQTQLTINRALEERILELRQRTEIKRSIHSPDTSSCHEVNVTTTDRTAGISTQSSPLSASLASSDGSLAFHEVKNLQAIVDQKESTSKSKTSGDDAELEKGQTSSIKND